MKKMFVNRSLAIFAEALIGTAYAIYICVYFTEQLDNNAVSGIIATSMVTPHIIAVVAGAAFAWVAFFTRKTWTALTSAILFSVAALLFLMYAVFCIPMMVLGFVGYAKQRKINAASKSISDIPTEESE